LIRAVTCAGVDPRRTNGPGKLCKQLGIDMALNGAEAVVYDDGVPPPRAPVVTPRIGITKAADLHRRWMVPH
jgi:DNA-3-methyladenine glycosylase